MIYHTISVNFNFNLLPLPSTYLLQIVIKYKYIWYCIYITAAYRLCQKVYWHIIYHQFIYICTFCKYSKYNMTHGNRCDFILRDKSNTINKWDEKNKNVVCLYCAPIYVSYTNITNYILIKLNVNTKKRIVIIKFLWPLCEAPWSMYVYRYRLQYSVI